jgi:hypothetical protein
MRCAAAGSFEHLMLIEGQEFPISLGPPRERIDAIKSLDVIDPEKMKDSSRAAHPFAPPLKIGRAHCAPAIERNAPVLAPFLRERIILEERLGRRATEPVEHEFIWARENVGAVVTDANGNIAHQRHTALFGMRFDVPPLLMSDPLHITKEVSASGEGCMFVVRKMAYPVASTFTVLMLRRPSIPCGATVIFLDENAEERVIVQP